MNLAVAHADDTQTSHSTAAGAADDSLREVLAQLGEHVKPVAMARERTLPVAEPMQSLFVEGGLVRGRVVSCQGAAAASIANVVVRDALVAGAWLAVVDVAGFGADAAAEMGLPLERIVRIDTCAAGAEGSELEWIDVMGAAIDGFDMVITQVPTALCGDRRPAAVRKLSSRLQQRGAVVVALGATGALACDVEIRTERTLWEGLDDGAGHLRRRHIDITAGGRRLPAPRSATLCLTGVAQQLDVAGVERDAGGAADVTAVFDVGDQVAQLAG